MTGDQTSSPVACRNPLAVGTIVNRVSAYEAPGGVPIPGVPPTLAPVPVRDATIGSPLVRSFVVMVLFEGGGVSPSSRFFPFDLTRPAAHN